MSSVAGEEDIDVSGEIFNFSGPTVGGAVGSNSGPETRGREGWDEISEAVQHNN